MKPSSRAIGVLCVIMAARAAHAQSPQVFEAKGLASLPAGFKVVGGTWTLEGDKLKGSAANDGDSTLLLGPTEWYDVSVEVDVAFASAKNAARWFGIVVREGGESAPGVQFTVRQDTSRANGLEIAAKKRAPDAGWRVLRAGRTEPVFRDGRPHRVRIEAVGNWVCGYLDDKLVLRSCRGDEFARAGAVGLRLSGATVMIESIRISPVQAGQWRGAKDVRTRPLVAAHRGFSYVAPENTLASYRMAIETGADFAECDVYLTKDGVPVLMHDGTLERTAGFKGRLRDLTLEQVRQLDAGKWKAPKFAGERIPTLKEAIELTRGKLRFIIEIKEETIAPEVLKVIQSTEIPPQDLMIFSFSAKAVDEIAKLEPRLPTTWLVEDPGVDEPAWRATISRALEIRASAIGTSLQHVDPGFVRLAHECGLSVFVWTVNEPQDVKYLVRMGVDVIISDRPDMALEVVNGKAK